MRLLTSFIILFIAQISSITSLCVTEPLITSSLKYPICETNDGTENRINWTTCFVNPKPCNASYKYRTIDGSCNNLDYSQLGMAHTVLIRILPSSYQDNKHALALGPTGQRPLARTLSTAFFPDRNNTDNLTLITMQWGQISTHDMSRIEPYAAVNVLDCCQKDAKHMKNICLPILIPKNDYFYSRYGVTCVNQIRTNVTVIGNCDSDQPGQQINDVTHAIDASIVYGSRLSISYIIREFVGGRLKSRRLKDGRIFLPNLPSNLKENTCVLDNINEPCYIAGDNRVNQNTEHTTLQIVLFREHNRIATRLQQLHPEWDDETVFQEARAIVIAIVQHITYDEWLQYYVGTYNMEKYDLYPKKRGYTKYNSTINFATINSFTTAAYRLPHSGIQGHLGKYNYERVQQGHVPISKWMNRPLIVERDNNYDEFILGLTTQHMQVFDHYYTTQMTDRTLRNHTPYGEDLEALDILRGRDHGLAPYVDYLELCTGFKATTFLDLKQFIPLTMVHKLRQYYKSVRDIDLMLGGVLEEHVPDTRFGPTFLCIMIEQFYRKKWGDRFWYEVEGQPHTFSRRQLQEIRNASISKLLCNSGDHITNMTAHGFLPPSENNPIVPCSSLPEINLDEWK